jgi:tyrosyl-tRNA synthetase
LRIGDPCPPPLPAIRSRPQMNIIEELEWRGLFADCTDRAALTERLAKGPIALYCGFDPTADSLHVGNLVPLLALRRFQMFGHHPIALAGGATGMVGDPSGKSTERNLQTPEQVEHNIAAIKGQLSRFLDFNAPANPARLVNNADWIAPISFLEFLRDVGKHITVNQMVAKDSVRSRMEDRESGISYTEFSYMLLQGYDFYHLRKTFECELQVGATDQWGNITVGTELTRKKLGVHVWGLTFPLLTKSDGTKYGKSASGAVFLDPKRTSPYRFYQFFIQSEDADVVKLLKTLTFVSREEIESLEAEVKANPGARAAQKRLAKELTTLVHGSEACEAVQTASEALFGTIQQTIAGSSGTPGTAPALQEFLVKSAKSFGGELLLDSIVEDLPHFDIARLKLEGAGLHLAELLVHAGLCPSKGQARKDVEGGGVSVNNIREANFQRAITTNDLLFGKHLLLRKGKRNYAVVTAK